MKAVYLHPKPNLRLEWQRKAKFALYKADMVYYFTSNVVDPAAFIYVGKDKVESKNLAEINMSCPLTLLEMRIS